MLNDLVENSVTFTSLISKSDNIYNLICNVIKMTISIFHILITTNLFIYKYISSSKDNNKITLLT